MKKSEKPVISYHKYFGKTEGHEGTVYKQRIRITPRIFDVLRDNVESEIAMQFPNKKRYAETSGDELFYLKRLRHDENGICEMTHTQTRFVNIYLKLHLKFDRNTILVVK